MESLHASIIYYDLRSNAVAIYEKLYTFHEVNYKFFLGACQGTKCDLQGLLKVGTKQQGEGLFKQGHMKNERLL